MHIKTKLPEEIVLKIFSEFDSSELRKLLTLSQEWRELLIKNVEVMRKLPVILKSDSWREKLEFLKSNGHFVRKIRFDETIIENYDDIIEILSITPNVESIEFRNLQVREVETENPLKIICMSRLRHLTISDDSDSISVWKFVSMHLQTNLRSVTCFLNDHPQSSHLISILRSNPHLKSLDVSTRLDEILSLSDDAIDNMEMRLSSLKVTANLIKFNGPFLKFIECQTELKHVDFQSRHIDFRYYELLLEKHQNLHSLCIDIDILATDDCLRRIKTIKPNQSVQCLHITGKNRHLNVFEALLTKFPRLDRLIIYDLTQFYTDKLCRLLSLTYLLIGNFSANHMKLVTDGLTSKTVMHVENFVEGHREFYEKNIHNFSNLRLIVPKVDENVMDQEMLICN